MATQDEDPTWGNRQKRKHPPALPDNAAESYPTAHTGEIGPLSLATDADEAEITRLRSIPARFSEGRVSALQTALLITGSDADKQNCAEVDRQMGAITDLKAIGNSHTTAAKRYSDTTLLRQDHLMDFVGELEDEVLAQGALERTKKNQDPKVIAAADRVQAARDKDARDKQRSRQDNENRTADQAAQTAQGQAQLEQANQLIQKQQQMLDQMQQLLVQHGISLPAPAANGSGKAPGPPKTPGPVTGKSPPQPPATGNRRKGQR